MTLAHKRKKEGKMGNIWSPKKLYKNDSSSIIFNSQNVENNPYAHPVGKQVVIYPLQWTIIQP